MAARSRYLKDSKAFKTKQDALLSIDGSLNHNDGLTFHTGIVFPTPETFLSASFNRAYLTALHPKYDSEAGT